MKGRISIIIPVYNSSQYIERCVKSIINQSYRNLEIIIVNDGSNDNSLYICKKLEKQDNRIIIISQSHKGVGVARNTGINLSTGEYISFIDSDDTIDHNFFEILLRKIRDDNLDMVGSNINVVLEDDNLYPYEKSGNTVIVNNQELIKQYLRFNISTAVWGKLYKRDLIGSKRFCKLNINEDFIFGWEIIKCANSFYQVNNIHYNYYTNTSSSLTKKNFSIDNMSLISHAQNVINDVSKNYPNLILDAKNYFYACTLHNYIIYYHYLLSNCSGNLFIREKEMMESILCNIKQLKRCILVKESNIDITELIEMVNNITNSRGTDGK